MRGSLGRALVLVLLVLGCAVAPARADNAPMWESPMGLAPGGPTSVRMTTEHVTVEVVERGTAVVAVVNATFEMFNPGTSVEMPVGFPNFAYDVIPSDDYSPVTFTPANLVRFQAWSDTAAFAPERRTIDVGRFGGSEWFVWHMSYPGQATTRVYVSYEQVLEPRKDAPWASPIVRASYVLRTGALWADTIGEARIAFSTSAGGGFVGADQAVEQSDTYIVWRFVDFKPTFDLDTAYIPAALWQELQTAELAVARGDGGPAEYLRATQAALRILGTSGPYGQPPTLVNRYAAPMRQWATTASALDTPEAWEALGDAEVYAAMPAVKHHGELACWPETAVDAYERASFLGSASAGQKRQALDQAVAFMERSGFGNPPPCLS